MIKNNKKFKHLKEAADIINIEKQRSSISNLGRVLANKNKKVGELDGVINVDPVMGGAYVDSVRNNEEADNALKSVEELVNKDGPEFGAKKQPKPKKPVEPKIKLDESLFLEAKDFKILNDDDFEEFKSDVYSALTDVFFKWRDYDIAEDVLDKAYEWFAYNFFMDYGEDDDDLDESIKKSRKNKLNEVYYDNEKKQEFANFIQDTIWKALDNIYIVANSEIRDLPEPPDESYNQDRVDSAVDDLVEAIVDDYFWFNESLKEDSEVKYTIDDVIDDDSDIPAEERRKVFDAIPDDRADFLNASKFDRLMMELSPDNYGNMRVANNRKFFNYKNSDRYSEDDISVDFDDNGNTYILVKSSTDDHLKFAKAIADYYDAKYEIFAPGEAIGLGAQYPRDKYILRMKLTDADLEGPWETKEQRAEKRRAAKVKQEEN